MTRLGAGALGLCLQPIEQPVSQELVDAAKAEAPVWPPETLGDKGGEGKRDGSGGREGQCQVGKRRQLTTGQQMVRELREESCWGSALWPNSRLGLPLTTLDLAGILKTPCISYLMIASGRVFLAQRHRSSGCQKPTHQSCVRTSVAPQSQMNPSINEFGQRFGLHPICTSVWPISTGTSHGIDPSGPDPPPNLLIKIAFPRTSPSVGTRGCRNQRPASIVACMSALTVRLKSGCSEVSCWIQTTRVSLGFSSRN